MLSKALEILGLADVHVGMQAGRSAYRVLMMRA